MKLKTLGVCGGNGVILYPFRYGDLLGNIEPRTIFHTPDDAQWKLNFRVSIDKSPETVYSKSKVDVIVGAPDCGHSSVLAYSRAKKMGDPNENSSFNTYVTLINKYEPKIFLLENLPKLIDNLGSDLNRMFPDYDLIQFVESVSAWGNSQKTRIRLVIVGIHKDYSKAVAPYIILPNWLDRVRTSGELIKGLGSEMDPALCHVRESDDTMICLWYAGESRISVKQARRLWTDEFLHLKKWPVNYQDTNGKLKNQPGVYRNFADDPPLTVRKQNRQFNHDGYMLSPRECARIQGVPDSFKLWYDEASHLFCINKGRTTVTKCPPYEIGLWFYKLLEKIDKVI